MLQCDRECFLPAEGGCLVGGDVGGDLDGVASVSQTLTETQIGKQTECPKVTD